MARVGGGEDPGLENRGAVGRTLEEQELTGAKPGPKVRALGQRSRAPSLETSSAISQLEVLDQVLSPSGVLVFHL